MLNKIIPSVKTILSCLKKLTGVTLGNKGIVAGGAIANVIMGIIDGNVQNARVADIDLFYDPKVTGPMDEIDEDWLEQCNLGVQKAPGGTPQRWTTQATEDGYGNVIFVRNKSYRVIKSRHDGIFNRVTIDMEHEYRNSELECEVLLESFDLNCCGAAVNLKTNELVLTDDFKKFLKTRNLDITCLFTPNQSLVRYFKKKAELKLTGNDELNIQKTLIAKKVVYREIPFGERHYKDYLKYVPKHLNLVQIDHGYVFDKKLTDNLWDEYWSHILNGTEEFAKMFNKSFRLKEKWIKLFGRTPKVLEIMQETQEWVLDYPMFKNNFKFLMKMLKERFLKQQELAYPPEFAEFHPKTEPEQGKMYIQDRHSYYGAAAATALWGAKVNQLEENFDYNALSWTETKAVTAEQGDFLWKYRNRIEDASSIVRNWNYVMEKVKDNDKHTQFGEMLKISKSVKYENIIDESLASELALHGYPQSTFDSTQKRWIKRHVTYETIPGVTVVQGNYIMRRLHRDDPKQLTMGDYTNCCQHVGGAGKTCAWHSATNPDGCTYVVEKDGKIVAQSWTWRKDDTVVFDNIEVLGDEITDPIRKVYQEVANSLIGRLGITTVVVGDGFDDLGVDNIWKRCAELIQTPLNCYSDAKYQQYVISKTS